MPFILYLGDFYWGTSIYNTIINIFICHSNISEYLLPSTTSNDHSHITPFAILSYSLSAIIQRNNISRTKNCTSGLQMHVIKNNLNEPGEEMECYWKSEDACMYNWTQPFLVGAILSPPLHCWPSTQTLTAPVTGNFPYIIICFLIINNINWLSQEKRDLFTKISTNQSWWWPPTLTNGQASVTKTHLIQSIRNNNIQNSGTLKENQGAVTKRGGKSWMSRKRQLLYKSCYFP